MKVKYREGWETDLDKRLQLVKSIAQSTGWQFKEYQKDIGMVSFIGFYNDSNARVNIYLTKMTITTVIDHPKQGRNSLYRKTNFWNSITPEALKKIFLNPRLHTGLGYHRKPKSYLT